MGLNLRKSFNIGKNTKINLSKRGIGLSTGVKGVGPNDVKDTVGMPGTGVYYTKQTSLNKISGESKSNNVPPNNIKKKGSKKAGCGCLSMIAVLIIIVAVICNMPGATNSKKASSPNTQTTEATTEPVQDESSSSDSDKAVLADSSADTKQNVPAATTSSTNNNSSSPATSSASGKTSSSAASSASSKSSSSSVSSKSINASSVPAAKSNDNQNVTVYITNDGKKYHAAGCRYLRKSSIPISLKDAKSKGYEPCSVCNPQR